MFKVILLLLSLIAVNASGTCKFTLENYSTTDCSDSATSEQYSVPILSCWKHPDGAYIKGLYCGKDTLIGVLFYNDAQCSDLNKAEAHIPNRCSVNGASTAMKFVDVTVEGNSYGFGWSEGWTIFICQTLLFGACAGY